jgi:hypothetical protein
MMTEFREDLHIKTNTFLSSFSTVLRTAKERLAEVSMNYATSPSVPPAIFYASKRKNGYIQYWCLVTFWGENTHFWFKNGLGLS